MSSAPEEEPAAKRMCSSGPEHVNSTGAASREGCYGGFSNAAAASLPASEAAAAVGVVADASGPDPRMANGERGDAAPTDGAPAHPHAPSAGAAVAGPPPATLGGAEAYCTQIAEETPALASTAATAADRMAANGSGALDESATEAAASEKANVAMVDGNKAGGTAHPSTAMASDEANMNGSHAPAKPLFDIKYVLAWSYSFKWIVCFWQPCSSPVFWSLVRFQAPLQDLLESSRT